MCKMQIYLYKCVRGCARVRLSAVVFANVHVRALCLYLYTHALCRRLPVVCLPLADRLITVGRDGTGRIWNHNNGQRLNELQPR